MAGSNYPIRNRGLGFFLSLQAFPFVVLLVHTWKARGWIWGKCSRSTLMVSYLFMFNQIAMRHRLYHKLCGGLYIKDCRTKIQWTRDTRCSMLWLWKGLRGKGRSCGRIDHPCEYAGPPRGPPGLHHTILWRLVLGYKPPMSPQVSPPEWELWNTGGWRAPNLAFCPRVNGN